MNIKYKLRHYNICFSIKKDFLKLKEYNNIRNHFCINDNIIQNKGSYYFRYNLNILKNDINIHGYALSYIFTKHKNNSVQASEKDWFVSYDRENDLVEIFCHQQGCFNALRAGLFLYIKCILPVKTTFFIHSAGIKYKKIRVLFVGESGSGKTTISNNLHNCGLKVLSDENILVRKNNNSYNLIGTPFGKITDGPLYGKINAIFLLKHSDDNEFISLSPVQSMARAWTDSYYRTQIVTVKDRKIVFNNIFDMFSSIPCYEMRFRKDFDEWDKLIDLCKSS